MTSVPEGNEQRCPWCGGWTSRYRPNVPCPRCRRQAGSAASIWYSDEQLRRDLVNAYYDVLGEDPEFRTALGRLREERRRLDAAPAGLDAASSESILDRQIDAFVARWRLPRTDRHPFDDGATHVEYALDLDDEQPRLYADIGPVSHARSEARRIVPPVFPPFLYDPTDGTETAWVREHAKRLASRLVRSILDQAKAVEAPTRAAGWRPTPSHHANAARLRALALRLYRRAVLEWEYEAIAEREWAETADGDRKEIPDTDAVRKWVEKWAKKLGVPVPKSRKPGRPPKSGFSGRRKKKS